ncbi:MAG TPA: hypothetical protein VHO70_18100 [Chitinispirillaceae bacterium]|nr:hypothetical protein [Chitinispirillaceae bacterium]
MIRLFENRWTDFLLRTWIICLILFSFTLLSGCSGESQDLVRKKLDVILSDDMKAILEDVSEQGLLENPCYDLVFYKEYDVGNYSVKAVAHFYFLKLPNAKVVRKYRYYRQKRVWERYYNEYSFSPDSSSCRTK